MKIRVKGNEYNGGFVWASKRRGVNQLMIEIEEEGSMAKIASDFDGAQLIEKEEDKKPGMIERYEGYTRLVGISRENYDGVVRLTLEME